MDYGREYTYEMDWYLTTALRSILDACDDYADIINRDYLIRIWNDNLNLFGGKMEANNMVDWMVEKIKKETRDEIIRRFRFNILSD